MTLKKLCNSLNSKSTANTKILVDNFPVLLYIGVGKPYVFQQKRNPITTNTIYSI